MPLLMQCSPNPIVKKKPPGKLPKTGVVFGIQKKRRIVKLVNKINREKG